MTRYEEFSFGDSPEEAGEMIPIMAEDDDSPIETKDGDLLMVLPLRNMVLDPQVAMPVSVGRKKSLKIVREVYRNEGELFVGTQLDKNTEDPKREDIFTIGTVARIIKILEMPDGTTTVILQGRKRAAIKECFEEASHLKVAVMLMDDIVPKKRDKEFVALTEAVKDLAANVIKNSASIPDAAIFAVKNIEGPVALINFICSNFSLPLFDKLELLGIDDVKKRAYKLLDFLNSENQLLEIKSNIQNKTKTDIDQQQKEYYLQQQIKAIQQELGGSTNEKEVNALKEAAAKKKWNEKTKEVFEKELAKLERTSAHAPDYSVQLNYLEMFVKLPWGEYTKDNFDLKKAQKILDRDHYGIEKVKERIIEHLAVLKLKGDMKSPIICLYGPPGVGKTSLGKSVAEALKRKYVRMSLGGVHDESEVRGHRRTYIAAMPGRIVQNINKAQSSNPVFVLDEIDKLANSRQGDPTSALLEVLDPEQNEAFHDNFLDVDYDLSKVLFIATANNIANIPQPLLDRMEMIEVSGYIAEEKVEIAHRHLVPKQLKAHGIDKKQVKISKATLRAIVDKYTRESGVRELDRVIAKVMRKIATRIAIEEWYVGEVNVGNLKEFLGISRYEHDAYDVEGCLGVVTGLAWTSVGGEILYIESSVNKSKGGKLTLTGNLGDVMKESATLALEYIKSHAEELGIDPAIIDERSAHIHVPEGAIPKDGPSAGIAILTALVSAMTGRKVRSKIAMTGEITLRGKLLPVGGIKEKILAAKRAGITDILLCVDNRKDVEDIKDEYLKGLTFHYARYMNEALDVVLEKG